MKAQDDILPKVMASKAEVQDLFQEEIKKYDSLISKISDNLASQEELLTRLSDKMTIFLKVIIRPFSDALQWILSFVVKAHFLCPILRCTQFSHGETSARKQLETLNRPSSNLKIFVRALQMVSAFTHPCKKLYR